MHVLSKDAVSILSTGTGYLLPNKQISNLNAVELLEKDINRENRLTTAHFIQAQYGLSKTSSLATFDRFIKQLLQVNEYDLVFLTALPCSSKSKKYSLPKNPKEYVILNDFGMNGCLLAIANDDTTHNYKNAVNKSEIWVLYR